MFSFPQKNNDVSARGSNCLLCGRHPNYKNVWWMPYYLNVRVLWTSSAPLSGTALLFAVFVKLWVPENSHSSTLVLESYSRAAVQLLLFLSANRQDDGNGQVDGPTWLRGGCSDLNQWSKANIILEMFELTKNTLKYRIYRTFRYVFGYKNNHRYSRCN